MFATIREKNQSQRRTTGWKRENTSPVKPTNEFSRPREHDGAATVAVTTKLISLFSALVCNYYIGNWGAYRSIEEKKQQSDTRTLSRESIGWWGRQKTIGVDPKPQKVRRENWFFPLNESSLRFSFKIFWRRRPESWEGILPRVVSVIVLFLTTGCHCCSITWHSKWNGLQGLFWNDDIVFTCGLAHFQLWEKYQKGRKSVF